MIVDLIIAPVMLPAIIGPLLLIASRGDRPLQRIIALASTAALVAVAIVLMIFAVESGPVVYQLGDWPAPFGIVMVLDRLSAMMVLLSSVLGLVVLLYACTGWDSRGRNFHALFQFQLMGVNGAFLTGDIFNLFVFFEVLLIASYGLMLHGGGKRRLQMGLQYIAINLAGSTLFLFGIAILYGVTGTLNFADLALKVPLVAPEDQGLLRIGALLLLVVFSIKAALLPLHFWLPGTYGNAPAPVAALFAIMTKVGAYSILRVYSLIFDDDAGTSAMIAQAWLLVPALLTITIGAIGMIGAKRLTSLVAFSVVMSMGTLLTATSFFSAETIAAALYYTIHSTLAAAVLFLIVELVRDNRDGQKDDLIASLDFPSAKLIGGLFMIAAIAMAGMPPLSGFIGKLLILDSAREPEVWAVILVTSLIAIVAFGRAGSVLFWKTTGPVAEDRQPQHSATAIVATATLLAALGVLTIFAGPVMDYMTATASELSNTDGYIRAVLDLPVGDEGEVTR